LNVFLVEVVAEDEAGGEEECNRGTNLRIKVKLTLEEIATGIEKSKGQ